MFYEYKNDLCCKFTKNASKYHFLGILFKSLTLLVEGITHKLVEGKNKKRPFSHEWEKGRMK